MPDDQTQNVPPWKLPPEGSDTQEPGVPQPPAQKEQPKTKSKLKIVLAIIGTLVLLVVVFFGFILFQSLKDAPQIQKKVSSFMQYVSKDDFNSAYYLTSKEFKKTYTLGEFEKLVSTYNYQYSDFEKQKQTGFVVEAVSGQPTLYQYIGEITYTNGDKGSIDATFVKEEGAYKIQFIDVVR